MRSLRADFTLNCLPRSRGEERVGEGSDPATGSSRVCPTPLPPPIPRWLMLLKLEPVCRYAKIILPMSFRGYRKQKLKAVERSVRSDIGDEEYMWS